MWDFLFFFLFFLVGDSLLAILICHLLLAIKACITDQPVCHIDVLELMAR